MNKNKVTTMTRMAFYEQNKGKEDMKLTRFYRKDYASLHMWFSLIWMTIGYGLLCGALLFVFSEQIFNETKLNAYIRLGMAIVLVYIILLVVYAIASRTFYSDRHKRARTRLKTYMRNVVMLERYYGRESEK